MSKHLPAASPRRQPPRPNLCIVPAEVVADMHARLPAQTDEMVSRFFGISWNSWMKLRRGEPVRATLARRLMSRLNAGAPSHDQ